MEFQLKTRQICLFFIAFLPVTKFFILPSILAFSANEDMWISALLSVILDILTLTAVIFACRKAETDFFGLLKINFGKTGAKIVMAFYCLFFITKAIIPVNEHQNYVELTLYETMPNVLNFLPFFLLSFYICVKGSRIWGRCADILWLVTAVGGTLLFALSFSNCDFEAILPIGANGLGKILTGTYRASNWFGDCVYLMFFMGQFEYKKRDMLKIILSYAFASLAVIVFMIMFFCIFTSIAHRQLFALTETSKYSTVINNLGRFDYIGIICILFSGIFSIILPLYFATDALKKVCGFRNAWIPSLIINGFLFLFVFIFKERFASILYLLETYGGIFFILMANVLPAFTAILKKEKKLETV